MKYSNFFYLFNSLFLILLINSSTCLLASNKLKQTNRSSEKSSFIQNSQKQLSKVTDSFLEFDSKVNLNSDKKNLPENKIFSLNLIQTRLLSDGGSLATESFVQIEQPTSRFMRFIWAMLIVVILSGACFGLVKCSVDWANSSQTELNKMRANKLDPITKEVKNKFSYILNTEA